MCYSPKFGWSAKDKKDVVQCPVCLDAALKIGWMVTFRILDHLSAIKIIIMQFVSMISWDDLSDLMPIWVSPHEFAGFNKLITGIAATYTDMEHWLDIITTGMRFSGLWWGSLDCDEAVDHAIEVVEEGQQVEGKFNPTLSLQEIQFENTRNTVWKCKKYNWKCSKMV